MTVTTAPHSRQPSPAPRRAGGRPARRRGRWAALGLVPLLGLVAACQVPRPDVTFFGNGKSVDTEPTTWCPVDTDKLEIGACEETALTDLPQLTLQAGQPVQVNVPTAIARQPWQIVFRYATPNGDLGEGRTAVFTDRQLAYTLEPPDAGDLILRVRVETGFLPTAQDEFATTQVWELLIRPQEPSDQTSPDFDTADTKGTA